MKSILLNIGAALLVLVSVPATAQVQKVVETSFWVGGTCDHCKQRIEGAVDMKGVKYANYELATHTLTVIYKTKKVQEEQFHKALHAVGHDTSQGKSPDKVYNKIHNCCKYRDHKHGTPGCEDHEDAKDGGL